MSGGAVLWAETPDEDGEQADAEAHGEVDESFAARRLRRWIRGMFGGKPKPQYVGGGPSSTYVVRRRLQ
jgi:hypothetical protein